MSACSYEIVWLKWLRYGMLNLWLFHKIWSASICAKVKLHTEYRFIFIFNVDALIQLVCTRLLCANHALIAPGVGKFYLCLHLLPTHCHSTLLRKATSRICDKTQHRDRVYMRDTSWFLNYNISPFSAFSNWTENDWFESAFLYANKTRLPFCNKVDRWRLLCLASLFLQHVSCLLHCETLEQFWISHQRQTQHFVRIAKYLSAWPNSWHKMSFSVVKPAFHSQFHCVDKIRRLFKFFLPAMFWVFIRQRQRPRGHGRQSSDDRVWLPEARGTYLTRESVPHFFEAFPPLYLNWHTL